MIRLSHMPGEEPKKRGNKFRAKRSRCHQGHSHASVAEARRCDTLNLLQRAGQIRALEQQPVFFFVTADGRRVMNDNGKPVKYTADFRYEERLKDGRWHSVTEDVKGAYRDDAWRLRRAFFRSFYPEVDLREMS